MAFLSSCPAKFSTLSEGLGLTEHLVVEQLVVEHWLMLLNWLLLPLLQAAAEGQWLQRARFHPLPPHAAAR